MIGNIHHLSNIDIIITIIINTTITTTRDRARGEQEHKWDQARGEQEHKWDRAKGEQEHKWDRARGEQEHKWDRARGGREHKWDQARGTGAQVGQGQGGKRIGVRGPYLARSSYISLKFLDI